MQQLEEEDDCLTPRQSTTIALQYPSIPVTGTPDSWLSSSILVPMALHHDEGSVRSSEDTMSSLGDSTYDFIDDTSFATTDDEDQSTMTASLSSERNNINEASETQDLERILCKEDVTAHDQSSHDAVKQAPEKVLPNSVEEKEPAHHESFTQTPQQQGIEQQGLSERTSIVYQNVIRGEGVHVLQHPSATQHFTVTVKQHMLDQKLSLDGPYKILYVGHVAVRERIVAKIGAALSSNEQIETSGPLRYNVVPMPPSDDLASWPEPVLLDWSGHGIIVYQCVNASLGRKDDSRGIIDLAMEGHIHARSFLEGSEYSMTGNWEAPNIAIFCLSDDESTSAKQTRTLARSFVARHKIPSIIITEAASGLDRHSEAMTIDRLTPHRCVETKTVPFAPPRIVKRLPIDLSTFSRLDAAQLSQCLANLALTYGTPPSKERGSAKTRSEHTNMKCQRGEAKIDALAASSTSLYRRLAAVSPLLLYLLGILFAASICMTMSLQLRPHPLNPLSPLTANPATNTASSSSSAFVSSGVATFMAPLKGKPVKTQGLTLPDMNDGPISEPILISKSKTDLATLLLESSPRTADKSENFQIHVLGSAHLILRPPHSFTKARRVPKLNFNVTRGERILTHQISPLFDGVFALQLSKDEAYGLVNISVWTDSKPRFQEHLSANLGTSWLHTAEWKEAAVTLKHTLQKEGGVIQNSVSAAFVHSRAELRWYLRKTLAKTKELQRETMRVGDVYASQIRSTTGVILASTRELSVVYGQRFQRQRLAVAKVLSHRTGLLQRDLSHRIADRAHMVRKYARVTPSAYRTQLRKTQKQALKFWWSLTGIPGHNSGEDAVRTKAHTASRKRM
ncbi:MAG: hypothetical protein Q9220_005343 [cf. Caloplaca sp. 1 TL-2023]